MKVSTKSHTPRRSDAPGQAGVWAQLLLHASISMVLIACVAWLIGAITGGVAVAFNALAGVALTFGFLVAGMAGLRLVLTAHEALVMPGVMGILGFQILALLTLWSQTRDAEAPFLGFDAVAFGMGALAGAVTWQVALVAVLLRVRQLTFPDVSLPDRGEDVP